MTLAIGAQVGEVIAPAEALTLIVVPHPLRQDRWPVVLRAGRTLAELATEAQTVAACRISIAASINGDPVAERLWRRVRPKAGTVVVMRAVAEFEGAGDVAKTLVGIAGLIAGAFNPLLGAAVTIGGQLIVGALFPPAAPQISAQDTNASTAYSLGGSQNAADPWGVVPSILGRHRVYPKLGARSYTEFIGSDQFLRMLFVWGYGPLEISAIKIGETPIESFDDVEIETFYGYPDDAAPTLYPNEVVQDDLTVDLTAAGGAQTRTSATSADEISVDVVAPGGIVRVDGNGAAQAYTVQVKVEISPAGAGVWAPLGTLTFTGRSTDPIRQGLRQKVDQGQYDVRLTKISADYAGTDQVSEQVVWSALRAFRNSAPISFDKPLAVTAIRIRASSQLNGEIDQLNGLVASKCKALVDGAWVDDTVTNSPAALFRHVLQGPANARPVVDGRIDIDNLELWDAYCAANGFVCNLVCDTQDSVFNRLKAIAATGRAAVTFTDGRWNVIWDQPDAPIAQHFTPRNSWGFSSTRSYNLPVHGWRVRFVNEDAGYDQDERLVYDDGYDADTATDFEQIEFPGVTDTDLIWRFGRFHIAQARLRPEQYTLSTDFEHLLATRGDRVRVSHDVPLWGLGFGRIKSAAIDGDHDQVVLDEPVIMEAGKIYTLRIRRPDGSAMLRPVITDDGETTTLQLAGHDVLPDEGDLWMFGELDAETVVLRVLNIAPGDDASAVLTLVDDAPAISTADQGEIPAFDSHITVPVDTFTAAPINLGVAEAFEGVDGATATGAVFFWETIAGENAVSFDVEYRDEDGDNIWKAGGSPVAPTKAQFIAGLLRGHWGFRVRCVFEDGSVSKWAELAHVDITAGAGLELPAVENVVISYDDATATISWDPVKFSRLDVFYEVRKGDDWPTGALYGSNVAQPRFKIAGNDTFWIAAKAQPLPGITIYGPASSITIAGAILTRNVYATLHEHADGWDGVLTDCEIDGEVIRTTATNTIGYYEIAAGKIFDINFLRKIRIDAAVKAVGVPVTQNALADPDFLNNPDVLSAGATAFTEAWVEIAIAGDLENDVFAAGDVFASPDVFAGGTVFGDYQKYAPGEFEGRFFKLRAAFRSLSDAVYAAITEFDIVGDVPDRIDHYSNLAVAAAGTAVTFTPNGGSDPKPFKGGPGGVPGSDPHVQVTWNNTAGDELVLSALSVAGVTIQIKNGGVGVDRVVNLEVQGW